MNERISLRLPNSCSHNLKSKTCTEPRRSSQNRKWVEIVAIVVALALYGARAEAQQTGKIFRIGVLDNSTASGSAILLDAFRQELKKLGWIEGKNVSFEYRFADQKRDRLPDLAADLVHLKVDLVLAMGQQAASAAKKATASIPIVMATPGSPVASGLVASLAQPGGNVTGLSSLAAELNSKRLEILKDAVPKLAQVAVLRLPESIESPQMK
jgi:ABC-type uncharacterized transport system substrate-binding protein